MNELIQILEISQSRNGADFPLTINHLLNICKQAERLKQTRAELKAEEEERKHSRVMSEISWGGQS